MSITVSSTLPMPSMIGCAVIVPGASGFVVTGKQQLTLASVQPGHPLVYYLGAGWNKSGDFADGEAWHAYIRSYAQHLKAPLNVVIQASDSNQ